MKSSQHQSDCSIRRLQPVWAWLLLLTLTSAANSDEVLPSLQASPQPVPEQHEFYGRIEAVNKATVSAETQGRVEDIRVNIGDTVAAGSVLLTITSTSQRAGLTSAEANLADAQANLRNDEAEYQRISDLIKKGYAAKADMDRITARLKASKARVSSAKAALKSAREQLSYTEIKAPYSGILSDRHIEVGEAVRPGTLLLSGYSPTAFRVEVDIPQQTAEKVRHFKQASIIIAAQDGADSGRSITPQSLILYPTVDPSTSSVRVRLELPENTPDLYPGQFVKVAFTTGAKQRLLIPASSVVYRSEVAAVYIIKDAKPLLRQVRIGATHGEQLEVLAGISDGEQIAIDPVSAAEQMNKLKSIAASEP